MSETTLDTMTEERPIYQVQCYLEEQPGKPGRSNGILREKGTGRTILVRFSTDEDSRQLVKFLSEISARKHQLPDLVDPQETSQSVVLQGHVGFADDEEIGFECDLDFSYAVA